MTLRQARLHVYPLARQSENKSAVYHVDRSALTMVVEADEDVEALVAAISSYTQRDPLCWSCKSTWVASSLVQKTWRNPTDKDVPDPATGLPRKTRTHWRLHKVISKLKNYVTNDVRFLGSKRV